MKFFNYELIDNKITIDEKIFEFVYDFGFSRIFILYLLNGTDTRITVFVGVLHKEEFDEDNILCMEALKNMKEYCGKEYEDMFYRYLIL